MRRLLIDVKRLIRKYLSRSEEESGKQPNTSVAGIPPDTPVPDTLANLFIEAQALTTEELSLYRNRGQLPAYPEEVPIGVLGDFYVRMFALAWHKFLSAVKKYEEANACAASNDKRGTSERRAEALQLMAEHQLLIDVTRGILAIRCALWKYDPYDGGWVREGDKYVIELAATPPSKSGGDVSENELEIDVELEDGEPPEEEDDEPPKASVPPTKH